MKSVTITFNFPDYYDYQEMVESIYGCITDCDPDLADELIAQDVFFGTNKISNGVNND